jgi:hypothetical protein
MASEPAYVVALKALSKSTAASHETVRAIEREFYGQNDRACGILFGEWIGFSLERALKSVFRADLPSTIARKLFDFEGSVGSLAGKIDLAFALSLFGRQTYHDLGLIRLIRNEFAHCRLPLRFDLPEVKEVCANLWLPNWEHSASAFAFRSLVGMAEAFETEPLWKDKNHPKTRFVISCHTIADELFKFTQLATQPARASRLP